MSTEYTIYIWVYYIYMLSETCRGKYSHNTTQVELVKDYKSILKNSWTMLHSYISTPANKLVYEQGLYEPIKYQAWHFAAMYISCCVVLSYYIWPRANYNTHIWRQCNIKAKPLDEI